MFEFSFVKKKKNSILRPLKVGSNVKKKQKQKQRKKKSFLPSMFSKTLFSKRLNCLIHPINLHTNFLIYQIYTLALLCFVHSARKYIYL